MLVRAEPDGVLTIGQASHAWLSGQLARAWGNERFEPPEPREEVCLAAEQHDIGMSEWDLAPRRDGATGRPLSFTEMALADHLKLWSHAPTKLLSQSRYAGLLVSMHGCALYEQRDLTRASPSEADAVRAYLDHERAWQAALIELIGADPAQVRRNQRLVFTWDGLSLALCLRWRDHVARAVPAAGASSADLRLRPLGAEPAERFTVDPWPFADAEVTVYCEGRRLKGSYASEQELHTALERAAPERLMFQLVAAHHSGR